MLKLKNILIILILILAPQLASALSMPENGNDLALMAGIKAAAYIVTDAKTGDVFISKNEIVPRTAASLTKIVTALVVLDTKPKLSKSVAITKEDQVKGACSRGGACIKAKAGVKFTVDALFHAALLPSANNATLALARSTGLKEADFVNKMNAKAKSLGATSSEFKEPTGLDPGNVITASDYTKILQAAFKNPYLSKIARLEKHLLRSSNNSRYNQTIKNTDKLLADSEISIIGAKTGYLEESKYNFGALVKHKNGKELIVVVLGEEHLHSAFSETKLLVQLGEEARGLSQIKNQEQVLGLFMQ